MKCRNIVLISFFALLTGSGCLGRTGNVIDQTPVADTFTPMPVAVGFAKPLGPGTMAKPASFFASVDPIVRYSTLVKKGDVQKEQKKLHDIVDDQLDAVLATQDAGVPGAAPKSRIIHNACHMYLKSVDVVADAQESFVELSRKYQTDRETYFKKNPDKAATFLAAEAAAKGDSTKLSAFQSALKGANLINEWKRQQAANAALNSAKSNQGALWVELQGRSTAGVNMQAVITAYTAIRKRIDTDAAVRVKVIADCTAAGRPVPVPAVIDPTTGLPVGTLNPVG
ncbi:MAG: hypothetical protein QG632_16 [Candidatus Dependentiae bacterium]|nr:hypothetical protein [Candidatus Dependentiae bacterium]